MITPYYSDDAVTLHLGRCEEVLPTLTSVDHIITDPPYSQHVHGAARSRRMVPANDRGGRYMADVRRNVDLGFDALTPELRDFCSQQFARLVRRWVLTFSDVESAHLWAEDCERHGLDYVRTGAWIKVGATPQFSGDRPATGHEAIVICHPKGRKRWNGGGRHAVWSAPIVLDRGRRTEKRVHSTQKPLLLMERLMSDFTEPGESVLDAFAGSATTGIAAANAGLACVLIEEDEARAEVAAKRLEARPPVLTPRAVPAPPDVLDFGGAS